VGRDIIFYIISTFTIIYFAWDGKITLYEACSFIVIYVIYIIYVVIVERSGKKSEKQNENDSNEENFIPP
jgi:Ca2+/Na+ antiporter